MASALEDFFRHNLWANLRLLDALSGLTDEQLDLTAPGTYGTVRNTLLHLFGAEQRYIKRLTDADPPKVVNEREGFPGIDALRDSANWTGRSLIDVAAHFKEGEVLRGVWRGEPYEIPAIVVVLQAINHATEHRSHIVGILTQNGVEMPEMDGWAFGEELEKG